MQANDYATGVQSVVDYLGQSHGIRDRKALVSFLRGTPTAKAVDLHPGNTLANSVAKKLEASHAADFGKALVMGLAPEARAAFLAAANAANADLLAQAMPIQNLETPPTIEGRTGTEG